MYTNGMAGWPVFVEAMNSAKQEIVAGNCSILTSNSLWMVYTGNSVCPQFRGSKLYRSILGQHMLFGAPQAVYSDASLTLLESSKSCLYTPL